MDLATFELKISRSENLPVLPEVVSAVLKMADDPNAAARTMQSLIERDPSITAKILRVASSPQYGLGSSSSIARAISVLGMNAMRALVVGVAYQQLISFKQCSRRLNRREFWRHSLATGTAGRILAKLKAPGIAEELYTIGMLHDVGILVMDKFCPDHLDEAISFSERESITLVDACNHLYNWDHTKVGNLLARKWGMGEGVCNAITYHLNPLEDPEGRDLSFFLAGANHLANECACGGGFRFLDRAPDEEVFDRIGIPMEQYDTIKAVVAAEVAKAEASFQMQ